MKAPHLTCVLLSLAAIVFASAAVANSCLVRPETTVGVKRFNIPASVSGLEPQILVPLEGKLQLFFANSESYGHDVWSPTGDFSPAVGPYDPKSGRLYVWGYLENGWVEILKQSGTWLFGQRGVIETRLYDAWVDGRGDSVRTILRSPVLGVQFYQGTTAEHWLTKRRSYRVYQIDGTEMKRVPELEARSLQYVGDDPIAKMAVFAPLDVEWHNGGRHFVWYNGKSVIEPSSGMDIPATFCD